MRLKGVAVQHYGENRGFNSACNVFEPGSCAVSNRFCCYCATKKHPCQATIHKVHLDTWLALSNAGLRANLPLCGCCLQDTPKIDQPCCIARISYVIPRGNCRRMVKNKIGLKCSNHIAYTFLLHVGITLIHGTRLSGPKDSAPHPTNVAKIGKRHGR